MPLTTACPTDLTYTWATCTFSAHPACHHRVRAHVTWPISLHARTPSNPFVCTRAGPSQSTIWSHVWLISSSPKKLDDLTMWVLLWPQNVTSHFCVVKSSCDVNLWFHCDITVSWNITPWVQKKWLLTMLTLPWPQNVTSHFFTVKSSCDLTMWFHRDITVSWNITPWVKKKSGYS